MILPFSTQLNGKPSYFVQKIWASLKDKYLLKQFVDLTPLNALATFEISKGLKPKFHTIREDKKNRWRPGTTIDFFINARQKNMFRFAPRVPVVSTQEVFMTYAHNDIIEITIDDTYINNTLEFAQNDGFDTWDDFFNFFYPLIKASPDECYRGKLIHWTYLRY